MASRTTENKRTRKVFSFEEDMIILELKKKNKNINWNEVSNVLKNRTPRQIRDRWDNYLSPDLLFNPWSKEEDLLLSNLIEKLGLKWSIIKENFPGRSYSNVKNRWYSFLKNNLENKKLISKKIEDPISIVFENISLEDEQELNWSFSDNYNVF